MSVHRRTLVRLALPPACAAIALALGPGSAAADPVSFEHNYATPAAHVVNIPAGVVAIDATLVGASGASTTPSLGGATIQGGRGAMVTGRVAVVPGSAIWAYVGGAGSGRFGGFNGGANAAPPPVQYGNPGGGGGGASDIRTVAGDLSSRVIVAGGGGVAGRSINPNGASAGGTGGAGFSSGVAGANGGNPGSGGATPGGGGTAAAGGSGGIGAGTSTLKGGDGGSGTPGNGGTGGQPLENAPSGGGGGGGGGLFGGGGGGAGGTGSYTGGAGGGGGSSLVPEGGSIQVSPSNVAVVRVEYDIPDTVIYTGPPAFTNDPQPELTFFGEGVGVTELRCALGNAAPTTCTSPYTPEAPLADGAYSFEVFAINAQGNFDPTPSTVDFTVDTVAPRVSFGKVPKNTAKKQLRVKLEANEQVRYRCSFNGGAPKPCRSPWKTPKLKKGKNTLALTAIDRAGNPAAKPAKATVKFKRKKK